MVYEEFSRLNKKKQAYEAANQQFKESLKKQSQRDGVEKRRDQSEGLEPMRRSVCESIRNQYL